MDTAYSAEIINKFSDMKLHDCRPKSNFTPAICNFQTARKMAQDNLEHQPLPDAVMDIAFRKAQVAGSSNPGVALEVGPYATGVGCKNYKAGPTKCTKYRVYRPKTCGVIPKPLSAIYLNEKIPDFIKQEKACAMDLAIGWDYRTKREPSQAIYLDGTKASVAPPIFEVVKSSKQLNLPNVVHSGGVFFNTLGEKDFFDRDIIRQHNDYTKTYNLANRCTCSDDATANPTKPNLDNTHDSNSKRSIKRDFADLPDLDEQRIKDAPSKCHTADKQVYTHTMMTHSPIDKKNDNKIHRICRDTQQNEITYKIQHEFRCAFKVGIPQSNSSGNITSFDRGISNSHRKNRPRNFFVPKPRDPYIRKNYVIDTLAPPFAFWKKGSGYPDYWRLISVYQHAYKPAEKRKHPLLKTVYQ
ncbi:uncharacterized protein LOC131438889 isoform X2 [Malaya genurostris]|uniref:uncharacterized protein LOC131438889 isoform X2 n=1 Tax=Malaya genurostris TaxID=325434 RepID=UPI0026F3F1E8|nr:uncharacterized protein LOC131438889 isoform X2 [Malaya genurostris]